MSSRSYDLESRRAQTFGHSPQYTATFRRLSETDRAHEENVDKDKENCGDVLIGATASSLDEENLEAKVHESGVDVEFSSPVYAQVSRKESRGLKTASLSFEPKSDVSWEEFEKTASRSLSLEDANGPSPDSDKKVPRKSNSLGSKKSDASDKTKRHSGFFGYLAKSWKRHDNSSSDKHKVKKKKKRKSANGHSSSSSSSSDDDSKHKIKKNNNDQEGKEMYEIQLPSNNTKSKPSLESKKFDDLDKVTALIIGNSRNRSSQYNLDQVAAIVVGTSGEMSSPQTSTEPCDSVKESIEIAEDGDVPTSSIKYTSFDKPDDVSSSFKDLDNDDQGHTVCDSLSDDSDVVVEIMHNTQMEHKPDIEIYNTSNTACELPCSQNVENDYETVNAVKQNLSFSSSSSSQSSTSKPSDTTEHHPQQKPKTFKLEATVVMNPDDDVEANMVTYFGPVFLSPQKSSDGEYVNIVVTPGNAHALRSPTPSEEERMPSKLRTDHFSNMNSPEPSANCDNLHAPDPDTNSGPPPLPVTSVAKVLDGQIEQLGTRTSEGRGGERGGKGQADTHVKYEDPATEIKCKANQGETELEPDSKTITGEGSQALGNSSVLKPVPKKRGKDFSNKNSDDKEKVRKRSLSSKSSSSSSSGSSSSSEDRGHESPRHGKKGKKNKGDSYTVDDSSGNSRPKSSGGAGISVNIRPDGKTVEYLDPHKFLVKSKDDSTLKILDLSNALKIPVTSVGSMQLERKDIVTSENVVKTETVANQGFENKVIDQEFVEQQHSESDQCINPDQPCEELTKRENFDFTTQVLPTESSTNESNVISRSKDSQFVDEMEHLSPEEKRNLVVSAVDEPAELRGFIEYISPISSPKLLFKKVQDLDLPETSVDEDREREKTSSSSSSSDSETDSHSKESSAKGESSRDSTKIEDQQNERTKDTKENVASRHVDKKDVKENTFQEQQQIFENGINTDSMKHATKDENVIVATLPETVTSPKDDETIKPEEIVAKQLAERIVVETSEKMAQEHDSSLAKQSSTSNTSNTSKSTDDDNIIESDDLELPQVTQPPDDSNCRETIETGATEEHMNKSSSSSSSSSLSSKHSEKDQQKSETKNAIDICICQPEQSKICENDSWDAVYKAFENADETKKFEQCPEEKLSEQRTGPEKEKTSQKDKESDTSKSSASDRPDGYLPDLSGPMVPDESVSPYTQPDQANTQGDDKVKQDQADVSTSSSSSGPTKEKHDHKKNTSEKVPKDKNTIKNQDMKESKPAPKPKRKREKRAPSQSTSSADEEDKMRVDKKEESKTPEEIPATIKQEVEAAPLQSESITKENCNLSAQDSSMTSSSGSKNEKREKSKKNKNTKDKSVSSTETRSQKTEVNTSTSTTSSGDSGHSSKKSKSKLFSWPFKRHKKKGDDKKEQTPSSSDDKDNENKISKTERPDVEEKVNKSEEPKLQQRILPRTSTPMVKQTASLSSGDDRKDQSINTSSEGTSLSVAGSSTPTSKQRNQGPESEQSFSSHQSSGKRSSSKSTSSSDSGKSTPKASRAESPSSPLNRTYTTQDSKSNADNNTTLNESLITRSDVSTPKAEDLRGRQRTRSGSSSSRSSKHSEMSELSKEVSKEAFEKPLLVSSSATVSEDSPKPRKKSKGKDKEKDRSASATSRTSQSETSELDSSIASDAHSQQKKEELKRKKEKEEKKKKKKVDSDTSTCQSETSNRDTSLTSYASSLLDKEKRKKEKEDRKREKEKKQKAEKEKAEKEKAEKEAEKKKKEANKEKKRGKNKEEIRDKQKPKKEESKEETIEMVKVEKKEDRDKDLTKTDTKKKKEKRTEESAAKTPLPDVTEQTNEKEKKKKNETESKHKKIKEQEKRESKKKEEKKRDKKVKEKIDKSVDEPKVKDKKESPKSNGPKAQEKGKTSKSSREKSKKSVSTDTSSSSSSSSSSDENKSMKETKPEDKLFKPIKESKAKPEEQQKASVIETMTRSALPEVEQGRGFSDSVAQEVKADTHNEDIQKANIQKVESQKEEPPSGKRNHSDTPVRPPRTPKSQKSGKLQKFLPSLRSPTKKEFDTRDKEFLNSPRQFDGQYHREDDVTQDVPEKVTKRVEKPKRKSQDTENLQYADAYDADDQVVEPPVYSQPRHFVVVAVDFGTTHSGYAFSFTRDPDHPYMMRRWAGEEAGVVNQKTLTSLLLTPDGEFHSFGYSARSSYLNLVPLEARHWLYFSTFKMELHHNADLNRETTLVASNGVRFPALKVFAFSLEFFKHHALQQLSDQSGTELLNEDIRWVITVPAIWKAPAKQFMRQAAYEAGMASPSFPEQLLVALEPEAASIFCRRLRMHQLVPEKPIKRPLQPPSRASSEITNLDPAVTELTVDLNKSRSSSKDTLDSLADELIESQVQGSRYLIVDCGGGTVDITVHELDPSGHIKELHRATGGPYGSVGIDNEFERLLCSIFGIEFVEHYKRKYPMGWVHLMTDFESRKRSASPYKNNSSNVSPPFTFINDYKKHKCDPETTVKRYGDSEIEWSAQGMLRLTPVAMRKLFLPTVTHIKQAVGDVLNHPNAREVKYMFLVGGFAESPILQYEIRQEFGNIIKILIPQEVSLAILKGAVLFGIDPSIVNVRRSRLTYGVGILNRFDPKRHPASKRVKRDGVDWCTDIFDKYVETDQPVMLGNTVIRSYTPAKSGQISIVLNIYSSVNPNVKFITDPGVTRCGTLCLSLPELDSDDANGATGGKPPPPREIQTRMSFGDTEINVVAIDMATGRVVKASVDFLGR